MIEDLKKECASYGLFVMGARGDTILIGAAPGMWDVFTSSSQANDNAPHPLDRWSRQVIIPMAQARGGHAVFPSDGPPYPPFIAWAKQTGRFFSSPVGMLVHDVAGLMISIRGAIIIPDLNIAPSSNSPSPCVNCPMPCAHTCPVEALVTIKPYDVDACKSFLNTPGGTDCMKSGCIARRACPVSQSFGREPAQSGFHMRMFMGHRRG